MHRSLCPCNSGKTYNACCGPYLDRSTTAKTVKQLMRSRYSAYALGGHENYLLESWHPAAAGGLTAESMSAAKIQWQGLEILNFSQQGNAGTVEFQAQFIDGNGKPGVHHEISRFIRVQGKWLYVDGD
jgi:SEC-C motif-containing protein